MTVPLQISCRVPLTSGDIIVLVIDITQHFCNGEAANSKSTKDIQNIFQYHFITLQEYSFYEEQIMSDGTFIE